MSNISELIEAVKAATKEYISPEELAREYGMSVSTQSKMRSAKKIPYHMIGSYVRYKVSDIHDWLDEAKVV